MARKGILPRRKRGRATLGGHPSNPYLGGTTTITSTTSNFLDSTTSNSHDIISRQYDNFRHHTEISSLSQMPNNTIRSRSLSPPGPPFHFANLKLPYNLMKPKMMQ